MEMNEYIAAVRSEGERLLDAAGSGDLDRPVPSCDDWVVHDLAPTRGRGASLGGRGS